MKVESSCNTTLVLTLSWVRLIAQASIPSAGEQGPSSKGSWQSELALFWKFLPLHKRIKHHEQKEDQGKRERVWLGKGIKKGGNCCCSAFCPGERNFKYLPDYMGKILGEDMVSTFPACGTLSIRLSVRQCSWFYTLVMWKAHICANWWLAPLFQPRKRHFVVSELERIQVELLKLLVDRTLSLCDPQKSSLRSYLICQCPGWC